MWILRRTYWTRWRMRAIRMRMRIYYWIAWRVFYRLHQWAFSKYARFDRMSREEAAKWKR